MSIHKARKIGVDEARCYWAHPSQKIGGVTPDTLPEDGFEYWASGPVCGAFHFGMWPGVFMAHYGVKPEAWGQLIAPAISVLEAFWRSSGASLIIGWTPTENRQALSFAARLGFKRTGEMRLANGQGITTQEWRLHE